MFEKVFVTVGTTSFEQLIDVVLTDKALQQFVKWNVKEVRIQAGDDDKKRSQGSESDQGYGVGDKWTRKKINFEIYDKKASISEDMNWADLVISHAGAGTTIEALDLGKCLLVVPNEKLMDNHQKELADKLRKESYAFMATIDTFFEDCEQVDPDKIKEFPEARPELLCQYISKSKS